MHIVSGTVGGAAVAVVCDAREGLSGFSCGKNCTGTITRCGSAQAFVECIDGTF